MQSLEDLTVPYWLLGQFPPRRRSISYDNSDASHKLRKLSLPTTLITYPPSPALSWEGDGPGSPRPRFRDGYFSNVFSSTPPNSGFDTSEAEFRINPYSPSGVDPPRPARTGFEWVWFPEGYWAEREAPGATRKSPTAGFLSKLRGRSGKSISDPGLRRGERSSGRDPSQKTPTPQIATPFSPFFSEEAHVASLQHPLGQRPKYLNDLLSPRVLHESLALSRASEDDLTPIVEATVGTSEEEDSKAGVLCIPRRRKMKKSSRGESGEFRTPRPVEEVSSVAPDAVGRSPGTSLSKSSVRFREEVKFKDDTNGSSLVKKWFGKAPWHRKGSGETASSVTSSIREVLAGKTPPGTPVTESTCGSSKQFNSNFPGGEATRITTPPLSECPDTGRSRAFFSETRPPGNHGDTWTAASSTTNLVGEEKKPSNPPREWWDEAPSRRHTHGKSKFQFDMPEHLPTSPMCPSNPKHVSGGTGVCVYHGRRKGDCLVRASQSQRHEDSEMSSGDL